MFPLSFWRDGRRGSLGLRCLLQYDYDGPLN